MTTYVSCVLPPAATVVEVDETVPRLNVPPLVYEVDDGTVPVMMQPEASAFPVLESVRTYVMVSPGAGPTVAVADAHELHDPLKVTVGVPVQPLPGFVMVTPVTL